MSYKFLEIVSDENVLELLGEKKGVLTYQYIQLIEKINCTVSFEQTALNKLLKDGIVKEKIF